MSERDEQDPRERFPYCECNYCQADEHWWTEMLTASRERCKALEGALRTVRVMIYDTICTSSRHVGDWAEDAQDALDCIDRALLRQGEGEAGETRT